MKKKIMSLVLLVAMIAALTACGGESKKKGTLTYDLPEGFTEDSTTAGMYYGPDYPYDTSNVYVSSSVDDPMGLNYTEDQFVELITTTYESQGYTVSDIDMIEFTTGKLDDYDTLLIDFSYNLNGIAIHQIEFLVQIDKTTHVITYTLGQDSDLLDAFKTSLDSMKIVYE